MKTGAEIHFLAGQLFTVGITLMAVLPRMPFDESCGVGGNLSHPFRKALLYLIGVGLFRVCLCHLLPIESMTGWRATADVVLGTIHVVGQSFLCLTTAYILQTQLSHVINIEGRKPGKSLVPYLIVIIFLTVVGSAGSNYFGSPNLWCLVNLAEAISCIPVLKTLRTYVNVTSSAGRGVGSTLMKGPVLAQIVGVCEYWYLATCLMSFVAEGLHTNEDVESANTSKPWLMLLETVRHNQDNGIDDWNRLLIHSVFLNSIDEMQHLTQTRNDRDHETSDNHANNNHGSHSTFNGKEDEGLGNTSADSRVLLVRRRKASEFGEVL